MQGNLDQELLSLAMDPDYRVKKYPSGNINGARFHTKDREKDRKTQNSGVVVKADHKGKLIDFYGVIIETLEVEYLIGYKKVFLFKCDWYNVKDNVGIKIDKEWNLISVNCSRKWYQDQPYALASQAEQVFYIEDLKLGGSWHVLKRLKLRRLYDVPENEIEDVANAEDAYQENEHEELHDIGEVTELPSLERIDMEPLACLDADIVRKCG